MKLLFCGILIMNLGFPALFGATITPDDRYKTDHETSWTAKESQTYRISASASGCSFVDSKTKAGGDATLEEGHSSSSASAKKVIVHSDTPNTSGFGFSVSGVLAGSDSGSEVTWSATLQQKFFWLEPVEKIVAEGTSVTITAKGAPTESIWTVNCKEWKDWTVTNSQAYKASSISLNRNMWDKMQWTPNPVPDDWKCPPAGIYNISATTTEKSPATSRSADATITVLGLKPLYYRIGNTGNFVSMEDYNDDGVYELIIPYHDQIISVGDELKGGAKNNIDVFIKATLQPSANVWPSGKPTWTGAAIVSANDRSIAQLSVNDKGTSTVEVKYDDSYKVTAKIHVIKVSYEKDTGNKYGFDEPYANHPQNDYNTYISLKNNDSTSVKVKLDPFPNDLDFYAKSSNSTRLKIGSTDETKLNSLTSTVTLNGQSAGDANVSVYLKHNTNSNKNVSLQNTLYAKLYVEKNIDNWNIYGIKNSASSSNVAEGMTSLKMKTYANNIIKQAVCIFNNVTVSSEIIINYDINNNGALDFYYDGGSQPELSLIQQASTLIIGDPKIAIVKKINAAWRTQTSASVNDTSLTLIGSAYIDGWLNQSYTLGDGGNAETITVTGISGNTITFSPALTKTHTAGIVLYNHRLNGVSANPQIVEDNIVEETCLHETLHRGNVANLLDISGREENIMNWYVTGTATTLRQRKQQLKYSSNQENQWDKVPR